MTKDTPKDPRHVARDEELAKQADQQKAMDAFLVQNAKDAQATLAAQQKYELTGIRVVEGKP